jgi:hypothetical protein
MIIGMASNLARRSTGCISWSEKASSNASSLNEGKFQKIVASDGDPSVAAYYGTFRMHNVFQGVQLYQ